MARDDDDFFAPRKSASAHHAIGEPLDSLSIEELGDRIAMLRDEIDRIENALAQKRASHDAATSFFKGGLTP